MKYLRIVLVTLSVLCICPLLSAGDKSDKYKPKWVTQSLPESKSGTYIFVRAHGSGVSLAVAKQMAFVSMSQQLEQERGLTVNTNVRISETLTDVQSSNGSDYRQDIVLDVVEKGRKLQIVCREIDEFWEIHHGRYDVDVLYTVANKNVYGGSYDDDIKVTTEYGLAGLWSVIPGVGQMKKGSTAKGCAFLLGELTVLGSTLICEETRAQYVKKMYEQPKYAAEYNSFADNWQTARNICAGAAAAVCVYNLIDALFATGAKHVVINKNSINLSLEPSIRTNSLGMSLALKL